MSRVTATMVAAVVGWVVAVMAVASLHPMNLQAAPQTAITVTTAADEQDANGLCSLREAVQAANTNTAVDACAAGSGPDDVILIPAGHYLLTLADPAGVVEENGNLSGDLDLLESVTLQGAGTAVTIIDGNQIDRVFHQPAGGIHVSVSNLTVQGGSLGVGTSVNYSGAGFSLISNSALTLTHVLVSGNQASPGQPLLSSGSGGGIYNNGAQVTLVDSTVTNNLAGFGGGIYNGGKLTIVDSSILSNQSTYFGAGIIHLGAAEANIRSSTISHNIAGTSGGGLYLMGGTSNLTNVTISHNRANGYLGGGVWVYYEGILAVNIDHTTIYANFAGTGGGIYNTHQQGLLDQLPEPPAQRQAGAAPQAGVITLKNTIVANNAGGNCGRSAQTEPIVSLGYNLDSADDCEFQHAADLLQTDPLLGPLQDNGGPTPTHGLRPGSLAVDTGTCTDIFGIVVVVDQRSVARPQGGECDRGSFELVAGQNSDLRLEMAVSTAVAAPLDPLVYTMTVFNDGPDPAPDVLITDTLPPGLTAVSAAGSGWACQLPAGMVVCALASELAVGAAAPLVLLGTAPAAGGVLTNTAVVSAAAFDVDQSQNSAAAVTTIIPPTAQADLSVAQIITPALIFSGDVMSVTLLVTNNGPDVAQSLSLQSFLPPNATFQVSHSDVWQCVHQTAVLSCALPELAAAVTTTIQLTLQAGAAGEIRLETTVGAATPDLNSSNNHSVWEGEVLLPPRAYLPVVIGDVLLRCR
ncbi:MAG: DUF11 domain-containing protein [Anaerolineales bacterium]|nr:DUF11 domain-containing protein [Anaerolineales bacterium]